MTKIPKSLLDGMCIQVEPYIGNIAGAVLLLIVLPIEAVNELRRRCKS